MPFPLLETLLQAGSPPPPPPLIVMMGKSLITVSFCALVAVVLAGKAAWRGGRGRPEERAHAWSTIDSSLFWGALAGLAGLFHTAMGLMMTALSVMRSAPVEPAVHGLIAGGIAAALAASAYGLLVFLLTALVWLGFRVWQHKAGLRGA